MTLQTRLCIEVICRMRHIRSKEYVAICRILRHIAAPFRNDIYGSSEGARVLIVHSMRFVIHCFFNQRHRRVHRVTFLLAQLVLGGAASTYIYTRLMHAMSCRRAGAAS